MKKNMFFWGLNIGIPLFIGLSFYLIFRPDAHISRFLFNLFPWFPENISIDCWLLRDYGGDFCWSYALTVCLVLILGKTPLSAIICILCGTVLEVCQLFGILFGTFDILDIVIEAFACFIAIGFIKIFQKKGKDLSK